MHDHYKSEIFTIFNRTNLVNMKLWNFIQQVKRPCRRFSMVFLPFCRISGAAVGPLPRKIIFRPFQGPLPHLWRWAKRPAWTFHKRPLIPAVRRGHDCPERCRRASPSCQIHRLFSRMQKNLPNLFWPEDVFSKDRFCLPSPAIWGRDRLSQTKDEAVK